MKQNAKTALVRLAFLIKMLIKSQLEVHRIPSRHSVHFTPTDLQDPPFWFFEGLVPRLVHHSLNLLIRYVFSKWLGEVDLKQEQEMKNKERGNEDMFHVRPLNHSSTKYSGVVGER